jgi:REP element-mobilizing transposase RayT
VAEPMARLFLQTLYSYRRQGKFQLHAFVLMPEHFHLLLTPEGIPLERALQLSKAGTLMPSENDWAARWRSGNEGSPTIAYGMGRTLNIIGPTFLGTRSRGN